MLNAPQAPFLADLAMDFATIQSKEYADVLMKAGKPEQIDQDPIGTGPFELVAYSKDSTIRYRAFPQYWGPKPKLDALVFAISKDPAVRLAKLRANECQVVIYPESGRPAAIRRTRTCSCCRSPGLNIGYLAFNALRRPSPTSGCARRSTSPSTSSRS